MRLSFLVLSGAAIAIPGQVFAQRTAENVVTQSADAFGKAVGSEKIGLYSTDDIRGFNPIDAGNVRIEGLYFDHLERVPTRIVEGSTVRVGVAAQGFAFPAPTGIVDYALTLYQGEPELSFTMERGPFGGIAGSVESRVPLKGKTLGLSAGFGFREQVRPEGGRNAFRSVGTTLVWRPYAGAMLAVIAGGYTNRDDEAHVTLFPSGNAPPPKVAREVFLGQDWTDRNSTLTTTGVIGKFPLGHWLFEAGLFDFALKNRSSFADFLRGVTPDGQAASRTVIYDPGNRTGSVSGEGRVTRFWQSGTLQHRLAFSARGRVKDRLFGGTQRIDLGTSSAIAPDPRARPVLLPQDKDDDHVQQMSWGLAYGLKWAGKASLDLSVSRTDYTKRLDFVNPALPVVTTKDSPILVTATGSAAITRHLSIYGGYVQGLEEALVAPDIASNRSEAPPAIQTRQIDIGVRYGVAPHLTLVAGLFSVRKPYYNLDPALRYRDLGTVDNRGVELSVAGSLQPGLTVVAGALLLDPTIGGEAVQAGLIGRIPVGSIKRRGVANIDWRFEQGQSPWSVDIAFEGLSGRMANAKNTFLASPRETVSLGARYRFQVKGHAVLLRAQGQNLFNDYGWLVSSSGGFTYSSGRTVTAQLVIDI